MIVITLMGIVASILIPQFQPSAIETLESAAYVVVADIDRARNLAVTNNTSYELTFQTRGNRYALVHSGDNSLLDALPATPFGGADDTASRQVTDLDELPMMSADVRLVGVLEMGATTSRVKTLEFGSLGETTRIGETVIWLRIGTSSESRYIPISINPVTGLASVGEIVSTRPATLVSDPDA